MENISSENYLEILKKLFDFVSIQRNLLYVNDGNIDYVYSEKSYKIILEFFRKINFIETPIITNRKKVKIRNFKETEKQESESSTHHKIDVSFIEKMPSHSDVISIMFIISREIEDRLIKGGLENQPEFISINIKEENYQINCTIALKDIIKYTDSMKTNLFGLHPIKLSKEYEERCYENGWQDFIQAIKALSEYSLAEQFIIRKDNNHLIKKGTTDTSRDFDSFGHPVPPKSKDIIKYYYKEDEFKEVIMNFFNKIRFHQTPIIGTGKRVVMVSESGHDYTSDKPHSIDFNFYNGEPYYPDVIYILDKIKDLIMHTSDGLTNFSFGEAPIDYKTIHLNQKKDDFLLDCEIDVKDIIEFCQKLKSYYYDQVHQFPSSTDEKSQTIIEEIDELNNTFGISEQDRLMDLYTFTYTSLLAYDLRHYFVLFDYDVKEIDWKYFHIEYIKVVEKILGIKYDQEEIGDSKKEQFNIKEGICGLISSDKGNLLIQDTNGTYLGILWDIAQHNRQIVEALRNSRAHMYMNDGLINGRIQFKNSLRNTSSNIQGEDDVPNFVMTGKIESFETIIRNISSERYEADELIKILKQIESDKKNISDFEKILPCIEQIEILLVVFSKFQNLTEMDIPDKKLLARYKKAGEVAQHLININASRYIVEKLYSFDESKNKGR